MNKNSAEALLRKYESILDSHHTTLPLYRRDVHQAAYAVLSAHDGLLLPFLMGATPTPQRLKRSEEGMSQALRWLLPRLTQQVTPRPLRALIEDGATFNAHGTTYIDLADLHRMYGRKQFGIEVIDNHVLRFVPGPNATGDFGGFLENTNAQERRMVDILVDAKKARRGFQVHARQWRFSPDCGRLKPSALPPPHTRAPIMDFGRAVTGAEPYPLPGGANLAGFTAGQLRMFWSAIVAWSHVAAQQYLFHVLDGVHQEACMPTQVVGRQLFLRIVESLSGLKTEVIERILLLLSFRLPGDAEQDPSLRPLLCDSHSVAWSPLYCLGYRAERNALRLMARMPESKGAADNLIGGRETLAIQELRRLLKKRGYRTGVNQAVRDSSHEGEIDILAWNSRAPEQLLIVEIKASLAPDEINEVDATTKQMIAAQEQLRRCIRILANASEPQKRTCYPFVPWSTISSCFALVVSTEAEPNSRLMHDKIPAIALETIKTRLRKKAYASPEVLVSRCRERSWLAETLGGPRDWDRIKVGTATYDVPMLQLTPQPLGVFS